MVKVSRKILSSNNPHFTQWEKTTCPMDHHKKETAVIDLPFTWWHAFTKMAVTPLVIVRFWKFKIWLAQDFGANLCDVTMTSRATRRARWRHARVSDVTLDTSAWRRPLQLNCWRQWRDYYSVDARPPMINNATSTVTNQRHAIYC